MDQPFVWWNLSHRTVQLQLRHQVQLTEYADCLNPVEDPYFDYLYSIQIPPIKNIFLILLTRVFFVMTQQDRTHLNKKKS